MSPLLPFHAIEAHDALLSLRSSMSGLLSSDARNRLNGATVWSVAPPKPQSVFRLLWKQCQSPFIVILLVAIGISWWTGEILDAVVTFAIVFVNVGLGFFQEFHADREFFALQQYLPKRVTVRRDGASVTIPAEALVPGDVALFRAGQNIVCDGRILDATRCSVNEAALSGESAAVEKQAAVCVATIGIFARTNMVYAGTSMLTGQATVLVTALGSQTEFGKIGAMTMNVVERQTPLEGEIHRVSRLLTVFVLILAAVVLVAALLRGDQLMFALSLSAALAIAAIPEGLPMTLTVLLSAAMRRMFHRGVLVRHLNATEALGCVNVLCVDKTGTLTTGVMSVVEVKAQKPDLLPALGCFATIHAETGDGAFAGAATADAVMRYVRDTTGLKKMSSTATIPFDPTYRMSACLQQGADRIAYVMGAPDVVVSRCDVRDAERAQLLKSVDEMAARGLRVIAVASSALGNRTFAIDSFRDGRILGLLGIEDPLRESVPAAIASAARAGIRTMMMTGDHPETAKNIAMQAFGPHDLVVALGADFAAMPAPDRLRAVMHTTVFARMLPEHKLLVVEALHANGMRVAMTGDGVNDAPALKAADVGIAVGHATEVAKESSDLVLIDGDFGNITAAIAEGRTVFTNARNVTIFLLALGLGETFGVLVAFVFSMSPFLTPLLILWLNVVTDGIPAIFFAFEGADHRAMIENPRSPNDGLVSADIRAFLYFSSVILLLVLCGFLVFLRSSSMNVMAILTMSYVFIGVLGLCFVFVTRSLRTSIVKNMFAKTPLWIGVIVGAVFLVLPLAVPTLRNFFGLVELSVPMIGVVCGAIVLVLLPLDIAKKRFVHRASTSRLVS
ncbi:MAG: cation-transporting P-type ATPase [Patescibacteria group bacterium]